MLPVSGANPDHDQSRKSGFRASLIRDARQAEVIPG